MKKCLKGFEPKGYGFWVWNSGAGREKVGREGVKMKKVGRKFGGFARKSYLCTRKSR